MSYPNERAYVTWSRAEVFFLSSTAQKLLTVLTILGLPGPAMLCPHPADCPAVHCSDVIYYCIATTQECSAMTDMARTKLLPLPLAPQSHCPSPALITVLRVRTLTCIVPARPISLVWPRVLGGTGTRAAGGRASAPWHVVVSSGSPLRHRCFHVGMLCRRPVTLLRCCVHAVGVLLS